MICVRSCMRYHLLTYHIPHLITKEDIIDIFMKSDLLYLNALFLSFVSILLVACNYLMIRFGVIKHSSGTFRRIK